MMSWLLWSRPAWKQGALAVKNFEKKKKKRFCKLETRWMGMNGGERTEESSPGHHQREAAGCWYLPQPEGHRLPAGRSGGGGGEGGKVQDSLEICL